MLDTVEVWFLSHLSGDEGCLWWAALAYLFLSHLSGDEAL